MAWYLYVVAAIALYVIVKEIYVRLNPKKLSGEIVLITGGARGIGALMAERFAAEGCKIVLWDVNEQNMADTAKNIEAKHGGKVFYYKCDITDYDAVMRGAEQIRNDVGDVSILVNNAGVVHGRKFLDASPKDMVLTMNVNVVAHFWTAKAFVPAMVRKNAGHIVNIASAAGIQGTPGLVDYCASKHAAVGFNDSLRLELRATAPNVDVLCVCPFFINTGMFDGVKTNALLPILDPHYVVDRILSAVKRRDTVLPLPSIVYYVPYLGKLLLPMWLQEWALAVVGVTKSMEDFRGHGVALQQQQLGVTPAAQTSYSASLKSD